jgi:hypothetical protein
MPKRGTLVDEAADEEEEAGEHADATVDDEEMAVGDVVVAVDVDIELVEEVVLATDRGTRWISMELRPWRCLLKADMTASLFPLHR